MEKDLNLGTQSLLGYLPALLIRDILAEKINLNAKFPQYSTINTVSLFADISGFTKLSETYSKKGRIGPEFLAFSLNRYMERLSNLTNYFFHY